MSRLPEQLFGVNKEYAINVGPKFWVSKEGWTAIRKSPWVRALAKWMDQGHHALSFVTLAGLSGLRPKEVYEELLETKESIKLFWCNTTQLPVVGWEIQLSGIEYDQPFNNKYDQTITNMMRDIELASGRPRPEECKHWQYNTDPIRFKPACKHCINIWEQKEARGKSLKEHPEDWWYPTAMEAINAYEEDWDKIVKEGIGKWQPKRPKNAFGVPIDETAWKELSDAFWARGLA